MYHRFAEAPRSGFVSAERFEAQVRYLARHHVPVTVGRILSALRGGRPPPRNAVAITVDDGHADFTRVAWPILERHGVPATLFATTGFVDGQDWLWTDRLAWILRHGREAPALPEAMGRAMRMAPDAREAFLEALATECDAPPPAAPPEDCRPVTWSELRHCQEHGLEIGGHTHLHPVLSTLDDEALQEELVTCRRRLDEELGAAPRPFCYPNGMPGDYDTRVADAVRGAGFTGSVVAHPRPGPHRDPYRLARHAASESEFQFRKAVSGVEWLAYRLSAREP
jgi:peptidoglycan/xylan/chitin deacetylase (PgdA/CDA1 family)